MYDLDCKFDALRIMQVKLLRCRWSCALPRLYQPCSGAAKALKPDKALRASLPDPESNAALRRPVERTVDDSWAASLQPQQGGCWPLTPPS